MALAQSPGLDPHLDSCEQSAPLFGREIARAKALVPCVAGSLAALVYALAQLLRGVPGVPLTFLTVLAAVVAATLTALSSTMRRGAPRALYIVLAAATSGVAYTLVVATRSVLGRARILLNRRVLGLAPIRRDAGALRSDLSGRRGGELFQHRAVELREVVAAPRRDQVGIGYRRLIPIQAAGVADVVGD